MSSSLKQTWVVWGLAAVVAALAGCSTQADEEDAASVDDEIVGGERVAATRLRNVVEVQFSAAGHAGFPGICSGTVIPPGNKVLTAAHCVTGALRPTGWRVFVGASSVGASPADFIAVTRATAHPRFGTGRNGWLENDLAVLTLARRAPVAGATLDVVLEDPVGRRATAVGFGLTRGGDRSFATAHVKRQVTVTVHGFPRSALVAGEAGASSCQGDSGGPLFLGGTVIGVSSTTATPCETGRGVWTRIDVFRDWILAQ